MRGRSRWHSYTEDVYGPIVPLRRRRGSGSGRWRRGNLAIDGRGCYASGKAWNGTHHSLTWKTLGCAHVRSQHLLSLGFPVLREGNWDNTSLRGIQILSLILCKCLLQVDLDFILRLWGLNCLLGRVDVIDPSCARFPHTICTCSRGLDRIMPS